jgi:hypothetical protein
VLAAGPAAAWRQKWATASWQVLLQGAGQIFDPVTGYVPDDDAVLAAAFARQNLPLSDFSRCGSTAFFRDSTIAAAWRANFRLARFMLKQARPSDQDDARKRQKDRAACPFSEPSTQPSVA